MESKSDSETSLLKGGGGYDLGSIASAPPASRMIQEYDFEHGMVDLRKPDERVLHQQQPPLGCASTTMRGTFATLAGLTIIGLPYVYAKTNLIRQGEIGLARQFDGSIRILEAGFHLTESVFATVRRFNLTTPRIIHGPMNILRINPGEYGLCKQKGLPVVLEPGLHVINDPLFEYSATASQTDLVVSIGTTYIITVPNERIGLCTVEGNAHFLEPGRHFLNNPRFKYEGMRPSTDECISFGARHRVYVPSGCVGLAWDKGMPFVLLPGQTYNFLSPTFRYDGSRLINSDAIIHGSISMITVKDGKFGICYDEGELIILPAGRHVWDKSTKIFAAVLSAGQRTLSIDSVTSMSSDNVGLTFDAAITIQIVDAKKAVTMLAQEGTFNPASVYKTITDKSKLALSIIIGNNRLNRTFKSTTGPTVWGGESKAATEDPEEGDANSFKQHVHDVFMQGFSEDMLSVCGVKVCDMSVEDVRITNPELAQAMARGAVARTGLEQAKINGAVRDAEAAAEQRAAVTAAEGQARAMSILATAESERITQLDRAMGSVGPVTQQRELIRAAGEVMAASKATLVLGQNIGDVARMMGSGQGGLAGMMQQ